MSTRKTWILTLVAGGAFGWLTYGCAVHQATAGVERAVGQSRAIEAFLKLDPTLSSDVNCESGQSGRMLTPAETLRVMQLAGVLPRDGELKDLAPQLKAAHGIAGDGATLDVCTGGAELLARVALEAGLNASTGGAARSSPDGGVAQSEVLSKGQTPEGKARELGARLSPWLGDVPGAWERLHDTSLPGAPPVEGTPLSLHFYWPWRTASWGPQPRLDPVLDELFWQSRAPEQWKNFDGKDGDRAAHRDQIITYARNIFLITQRDSEVRWAGYWLSIVIGPEQWVMSIFLFIALALMWVQAWNDKLFALPKPSQGVGLDAALAELETQRAPIRWFLKAMPSVGFIGTVRGLSAALASADSIVSAPTRVEQAAAIGSVAATLGIAFTTTMVALVFGLAGGALEMWLEAREQQRVISAFNAAAAKESSPS